MSNLDKYVWDFLWKGIFHYLRNIRSCGLGDVFPVNANEVRMRFEVHDAILSQSDLSRAYQPLHQVFCTFRGVNVSGEVEAVLKQGGISLVIVFIINQSQLYHHVWPWGVGWARQSGDFPI